MSSRSTQLLALAGVAVAAAVAVAVAVLALGGSSTASQADYQVTVTKARDRVDFALVRITRSDSEEELIERIEEASVVVGATAEDLDDAAVAEGFEDENSKLVATLEKFSNELAGTAAQFQDPSFFASLSNVTSLGFQEWENVNVILEDMRKQGLEVPALERH